MINAPVPPWTACFRPRLAVALGLSIGALLAVVAGPTPAAPPGTISPAASVPANDALTRDELRQRVIEMTNRERAAKGLPPLIADPLLMQAAQSHADDMRAKDYFSHTDRNGGHPWDRTKALGYISGLMGENIAWGAESPSAAMDSWMQSEEHRKNILETRYRAIGVGIAGDYWVQDFGDVLTRVGTPPSQGPSGLDYAHGGSEVVLADFEAKGYQGWEMSGNCWGSGPEGLTFAAGVLTGWKGLGFATTAHRRAPGLDTTSGTGRALSPPFTIPADAVSIRFRIAGGRYPERCCLNLVVDEKIVRTATGESLYRLEQAEWDIRDLHGSRARLEIRDDVAAGANAFIHVDDIVLLRQPLPMAAERKPGSVKK